MCQNFPIDDLQKGATSEVTLALKLPGSTSFQGLRRHFRQTLLQTSKRTEVRFVVPRRPSSKKDWGCIECLEALRFLLDNTFYSNIFGIVQQIIGVSMGGPASCPASNLGLSSAERAFVDRFIAQEGAAVVRMIFQFFFDLVAFFQGLRWAGADDGKACQFVKRSRPQQGYAAPANFRLTVLRRRRRRRVVA